MFRTSSSDTVQCSTGVHCTGVLAYRAMGTVRSKLIAYAVYSAAVHVYSMPTLNFFHFLDHSTIQSPSQHQVEFLVQGKVCPYIEIISYNGQTSVVKTTRGEYLPLRYRGYERKAKKLARKV